MKIIPDRIKKISAEKRISVSELARRLGVDRSNIYHYLRADYDPKFEMVEKMADALGVSVAYLTGMSEDPSPTGDPGLDGFLDRFIRSTQPGSFGPVTVSPEDLELLAAYHEADPRIQDAVRRLLDLEVADHG